jgi:type VI secretion system protein ImpE
MQALRVAAPASFCEQGKFMNADVLFKQGKLNEAIDALTAHMRQRPEDTRNRTFLFELLCFAGEFERAGKHLDVLAQGSEGAALGAILYQGVIQAELTRREMFESDRHAASGPAPAHTLSGALNGRPFQSLMDADRRVGARLEVFAAGSYLWLPLEHVAFIEMSGPKRLRDLIWAPAVVRTGPAFQGRELGDVLLPALCPLSYQHPDDAVKLGRLTEWVADEEHDEIPMGQKMLLVDGEEIPFLEVRTIEIKAVRAEATA